MAQALNVLLLAVRQRQQVALFPKKDCRKNHTHLLIARYCRLAILVKIFHLWLFRLGRVRQVFFPGQIFEPHKIDGFTQQVTELKPDISRGKFNFYLRETIADVRRYKAEFEARPEGGTLNPFTVMRHCLYVGEPEIFASLLTDRARESFDAWLRDNRPDALDGLHARS